MQSPTLFDYHMLDVATRTVVQQRTGEVKHLIRRSARDILEIGNKLLEVKAHLRHGYFGKWLRSEFSWSEDTAERFIAVAQRIGEIPPGADFEAKALYLLAAPSTPEEARQEALTRARSGEVITTNKVRQIIGRVPLALQMSESNEWYTPAVYIEAARKLMGGIDVDPASNALANRVVKAKIFYDLASNGFARAWLGRVFLNPPYGRDGGDSNQEIWSRRLIEQYQAGITTEAVLLVNAVTDRRWFQPLWNQLICFTSHRIQFYNPHSFGTQPTHGNAFVYFGQKVKEFIRLFSPFGVVIRQVS